MPTLNTRSRIVFLVVVSALPALMFAAYSAWDERARDEARARQELRRLVTLAAQRQAQVIEGARQTLVAVSLAPFDVLKDPVRCNKYLANLLQKSSGLYHSLGIYSADNELLCNGVPWEGRVVSPDRLHLNLAKSTGKFSIGEYQVGRVTRQEGINFGYPIMDAGGTVAAVAFVAVNLDRLNRMAATTPLPSRSMLTVVDQNGVILARHPQAAARVGQKLTNARVLKVLADGRERVFKASGTDGVDRLFAQDVVVENSDGTTPVRVLVSIPMDVVFADANRALVRNLAGILAVTVLLVIGAWYGAEIFILSKIRVLLQAAARVHAGDLGARTGMRSDGEEISQVGAAFDEMTVALELRELELKRALEDLKEQAITDPLTGLLNRRYLREYLPRELSRVNRSGGSLAVIMVDIDHFKRVNDTYGHDAGDVVLRELGALLRNQVRTSDIACRLGGEEFALVMPGATLEGSRDKAEMVRNAVKALRLEHRGQSLGVISASLGVALFPIHAQDPESLLRAADEALYRAKHGGRDRVELAEEVARGTEAALKSGGSELS